MSSKTLVVIALASSVWSMSAGAAVTPKSISEMAGVASAPKVYQCAVAFRLPGGGETIGTSVIAAESTKAAEAAKWNVFLTRKHLITLTSELADRFKIDRSKIGLNYFATPKEEKIEPGTEILALVSDIRCKELSVDTTIDWKAVFR